MEPDIFRKLFTQGIAENRGISDGNKALRLLGKGPFANF